MLPQINHFYFKQYLLDVIVDETSKFFPKGREVYNRFFKGGIEEQASCFKVRFDSIVSISLIQTSVYNSNTYTCLSDIKVRLQERIKEAQKKGTLFKYFQDPLKCAFRSLNVFFNPNASLMQEVENRFIASIPKDIQEDVCARLKNPNHQGQGFFYNDILRLMRQTFRKNPLDIRDTLCLKIKSSLQEDVSNSRRPVVEKAITIIERVFNPAYTLLKDPSKNVIVFAIEELKRMIFASLAPSDLNQCRLVCKDWTIWIDSDRFKNLEAKKLADSLWSCLKVLDVFITESKIHAVCDLKVALESYSNGASLDSLIKKSDIREVFFSSGYANIETKYNLALDVVKFIFKNEGGYTIREIFSKYKKEGFSSEYISYLMQRENTEECSSSAQYIEEQLTPLFDTFQKIVTFLGTIRDL